MDRGTNVVVSFSGEGVGEAVLRVSFVTVFDPTFGEP